eukprot:769233-Pelagomonas_calceolata.AAC.1
MGYPAGGIPGAEGDVCMKSLVKKSAVAMGVTLERIIKACTGSEPVELNRFDSTLTEDTPGRS